MVISKNVPQLINVSKKEICDFFIDKKIIVLKSFTADFKFDSFLSKNTYDMTELPFQVPDGIKEYAALAKIYNEQLKTASYIPRQIILMNYNSLVGELLKFLRAKESIQPYISKWLIFAFFPEDEYLNESLLDKKFDEIVSMLDYPFIKKYEFPLHYNITADYFYKLVYGYL